MRQLKISKSITARENDSLEKYLQEIGKVEMISAEEEVLLAQKIRTGDKDALDKLTSANLRFVVSVAKQYQNQGLPLSDLINEGNVGLIKAANKFDETKGFKFISYAVWWIRQSIIQALAEKSRLVRIPINKLGDSNRVAKVGQILEQKFERAATPQEIAYELDVDVWEIQSTMLQQNKHISLDAPIGEDDFTTMGDRLADTELNIEEKLNFTESLQKELSNALSKLTERQAYVLKLFYGIGGLDPHSLEDIGENLSLTRERVRQIRDKALLKLKGNSRNKLLKEFMIN